MASSIEFDPNSVKYQICCGFHVTTGLQILCIFDVITGFAHSAIMLDVDDPNHLLATIIIDTIFTSCLLSPFIAIKNMNNKWMIPYFSLCAFCFVFQIYEIIDFMVKHFAGTTFPHEDRMINLTFMEIGLNSISTIIAFRCYQYLCEIQKANFVNPLFNV